MTISDSSVSAILLQRTKKIVKLLIVNTKFKLFKELLANFSDILEILYDMCR